MQSDELQNFDDPGLKKACCLAWAKECCTKALRDRVAQLIAEEAVTGPIKPPAAFWQRPFAGVAAAAVVLLVSGVAIFQFGGPGNTALAAIDPTLAANLVQTHDHCCHSHGSHQLANIPLDDYTTLGQRLSQRLHQPVISASLPESGWKFRGGAMCPVGGTPSAHLIFDQGVASVSVFSMPRSVYDKNTRYQTIVNNHPMAGFVDSRGAFCLVASDNSKLTPERLAALRDRMQASTIVANYEPQRETRETVAQLLH